MCKRYLTLVLFLFSTVAQLFAQNQVTNAPANNATDTVGLKPYTLAIGPKIFLGAGQLSSATLNSNFQLINNKITSYSSKNTYDLCYALGIFLEKKMSSRVAFTAELNYTLFSSRFQPTYTEINPSAGIDKKEIYSEIKNSLNVLQIPLYFKYTIVPKSNIYIFAGGSINLMTGGKVTVSDFATEYRGSSTTTVSNDAKGTLDGISSPTFSGMAGIGFTTGVSGKPLHLELRAMLPITGGEIYSSDNAIATTFDASYLFSLAGKNNLEAISGKSLNDFKMTIFGISASYGLFAR